MSSIGIIASKNSAPNLPPPAGIPHNAIDLTSALNFVVETNSNTTLTIGDYANGGIYADVINVNDNWNVSVISTNTLLDIFPDKLNATIWASFLFDEPNFYVGTKSATLARGNTPVSGGSTSANPVVNLSIAVNGVVEMDTKISALFNRFISQPPDNINSGGRLLFVGVVFD